MYITGAKELIVSQKFERGYSYTFFDSDSFLKFTQGDRLIMREVANAFLKFTPITLLELSEAAYQCDNVKTISILDNLKSSISMVTSDSFIIDKSHTSDKIEHLSRLDLISWIAQIKAVITVLLYEIKVFVNCVINQ